MKMRLRELAGLVSACIICMIMGVPGAAAATGKILPDDSLSDADAETVKAEARLFVRIKDGVMLSMAECELSDTCSPNVNTREVEEIIFKIDTRITKLTDRYMETNNKVIEEALLIYADAREGYAKVLNKLETLESEEGPGGDEGDSGEVDFSDLFDDSGEDL